MRYSLADYSENQIQNWRKSKKIVLFQNATQLQNFAEESRQGLNLERKMYFGTIEGKLATDILNATGNNFEGKNVALYAANIRKISLHSHGNKEKEQNRGQRPVTAADYARIPDVIGNPERITKGKYGNLNAATFTKTFGNERFNVFMVDTGGSSLDLYVQTMYINVKKGSIAGADDAETAPSSTSETTTGTASNSNVPQVKDDVKQRFSVDDENDAAYLSLAEKYRDGTASEEETAELQRAVEQAESDRTNGPGENETAGLKADGVQRYSAEEENQREEYKERITPKDISNIHSITREKGQISVNRLSSEEIKALSKWA